ncbi:MAG TPA: tetratricopeptide repeat-containing protein, partial [Polyangiaceae bacterium]|nr:tetratricopeptide repeat-containing protein [Polyangiaceae bacterium]
MPEQDREDAEAYVNGGQLNTKRAGELERQLAKHDEEELAEQVRARRLDVDHARALELLTNAGQAAPQELFELAESLKQYGDFALARRLLVSACELVEEPSAPALYRKIFQQAAFCISKDPDLPLEWKLARALEVLSRLEDLKSSTDPVSLGIAGAIHKRRWEHDGRREHLEQALQFYLRGYASGAPAEARDDLFAYLRAHPALGVDSSKDFGSAGINAAFILDLLAHQREKSGLEHALLDDYRERARLIREDLTRALPALEERAEYSWLRDEWWYYATVAEAYFGLHRYAEAAEWLIDRPQAAGLRVALENRSSVGLRVPSWQYESTARQLAHLARIQNLGASPQGESDKISEATFEQSEAAQLLREFLGGDRKAVLSAFRGKFGLALSGGGFRASLFHIGVLARLAEIGLLRHVEVISCVSGGSIVGAYYYLLLRNLLQTKTDEEIETSDYVQLVKRLEHDFLSGVQRNLRTRVSADFTANLKMLLRAGYSRATRLAELYERELYAQIPELDERGRPLEVKRRLLRDLVVAPLESDGYRQREFNPRWDNWRRDN